VQAAEVIDGTSVQLKASDLALRDKESGKGFRLGWLSWLCLAWLVCLSITAAAAGLLPLADPTATDIANRLVAPSEKFWVVVLPSVTARLDAEPEPYPGAAAVRLG